MTPRSERPAPEAIAPSAEAIQAFARRVVDARRRVADIHLRAATPAGVDRDRAFGDASQQLLTLVEELRAAEEELRVQNDELLRAQELLVEEQHRFQELFDFAPVAYLVTDSAGAIRRANLRAAALLGADRQLLVGKPLAVFVDEASRRAFRRQVDTLCGAGSVGESVLTLRPRGGAPVTCALSAGARTGRDGSLEVRWVIRDVGEIRRAEEALRDELERERAAREAAERASREKTDMLAVLSHELRTPLQAIAGYVSVLELEIHGRLGDRQRDSVRRIGQAESHLLGLVNAILDLTKIEGGHTAPALGDVPLDECLRALQPLVAPQLEAAGIAFAYRAGEPAGAVVRADRGRLEQIVLNLLSNAIKFTARGGSVVLEWEPRDGQLHVRVRDTGCGIPAGELETVFQPWVQSGARRDLGAGLGLAIARDLARAMGGDLTVESIAGRGSTFTLTLAAGEMR